MVMEGFLVGGLLVHDLRGDHPELVDIRDCPPGGPCRRPRSRLRAHGDRSQYPAGSTPKDRYRHTGHADALQSQAFSALTTSPAARAYYDTQRARGLVTTPRSPRSATA
jgi:hypothetical protein